MGLDASDQFDAVERAWRVHCGDGARRTPVEYRRSTPPTPWYDAVQCDDTAAGSDASDAALALPLPLGAAVLTADAGGRATFQFSSLQMPSAGEDQPPRR